MCLIAFRWQPGSAIPLQLIGNRDEFHARPTAPLAPWLDAPWLVGGRDLEAAGSWLAANRHGTVAALTNVRDVSLTTPASAPSRGQLVRQALECDDIATWLGDLAEGKAAKYAGFNLLVATPTQLWCLHRGREQLSLHEVPPGIHGLSNAALNSSWPKLLSVTEALQQADPLHFPGNALAAFKDSHQAPISALPNTGVGTELEQQLSAAFIVGERYGTRATSWLTLADNGDVSLTEQRFGPWGAFEGETTLSVPCER
ncbi:MAG: NRDE family protein [Halomonas sp.]